MHRKLAAVLVSLAILLVVAGTAYAAYLFLTTSGTLDVSEAIAITPPAFTLTAMPGETVSQQFTVSNAASAPLTVSLAETVVPSPTDVTITLPRNITVPATGSVVVDMVIEVATDAAPGTYTISINWSRE